MKLTVTNNLNVRIGAPSVNAPNFQYIAPGDAIDVDGNLYKGDDYDGNDQWYKDESENYYWSGGVAQINFGWSIRLLGVDKIWSVTKGKGIKIAIIDSGIDLKNSDLNLGITKKYNILDNSDNVQDNYFHGTYCSTIVASRGLNGVIGVAPSCDLIIIKILEDDNTINTNNINFLEDNRLNGIKKAIEFGADIISMSFGSTKEYPQTTAYINNLISAGKICIAAAGNNPNDVVEYPANIKGMISVGNIKCINPNAQFGQGEFDLSDRTAGNTLPNNQGEGVTIVAPGDGVDVYTIGGGIVHSVSGTSYATPYVAGVAALWLSVIQSKKINISNNHEAFRKFIIDNAYSDSQNYNQLTWGEGIINPNKILSI